MDTIRRRPTDIIKSNQNKPNQNIHPLISIGNFNVVNVIHYINIFQPNLPHSTILKRATNHFPKIDQTTDIFQQTRLFECLLLQEETLYYAINHNIILPAKKRIKRNY